MMETVMTDQVNTDALRLFGEEMRVELPEHSELADQITAAADELDRLRRIITDSRLFSDDERAARATARLAMMVDYVPAEDVARLRDVIDTAPHAPSCYVAMGVMDGPCDCWKAGVL
jgi:hypothetical protein